jgi:ZIP family zinc transporter
MRVEATPLWQASPSMDRLAAQIAGLRALIEQRGAPTSFPMPLWAQAAFWGGLAGSALLIGAALGYALNIPQRLIAGVMAFGAGVLISALAFDLMDEAFARGGFAAAAIGFIGGAVIYTLATLAVDHRGARRRKRSHAQPTESETPGSGLALAIGALIDGIPESIAIGVSMIQGGAVSAVAVAAVFLSNVPEGLSSAAGMRRAGRPARYVFTVWAAIAAISALATRVGYTGFRAFSAGVIAATTAIAAGAILAMLADTMMPEAFAEAHDWAGLITVLGFLAAFVLTKLSGG